MMKVHKLSAGGDYTCLTNQVAVDEQHRAAGQRQPSPPRSTLVSCRLERAHRSGKLVMFAAGWSVFPCRRQQRQRGSGWNPTIPTSVDNVGTLAGAGTNGSCRTRAVDERRANATDPCSHSIWPFAVADLGRETARRQRFTNVMSPKR